MIATYQHKKTVEQVKVVDIESHKTHKEVVFTDRNDRTCKKGLKSFKKDYFYVKGQRL